MVGKGGLNDCVHHEKRFKRNDNSFEDDNDNDGESTINDPSSSETDINEDYASSQDKTLNKKKKKSKKNSKRMIHIYHAILILCCNWFVNMHALFEESHRNSSNEMKGNWLSIIIVWLKEKYNKSIYLLLDNNVNLKNYYNPFTYFSSSPDSIDTWFLLFTRENPTEQTIFKSYNPTDEEIKASNFDGETETIIIIHGFRSSVEDWQKVKQ